MQVDPESWESPCCPPHQSAIKANLFSFSLSCSPDTEHQLVETPQMNCDISTELKGITSKDSTRQRENRNDKWGKTEKEKSMQVGWPHECPQRQGWSMAWALSAFCPQGRGTAGWEGAVLYVLLQYNGGCFPTRIYIWNHPACQRTMLCGREASLVVVRAKQSEVHSIQWSCSRVASPFPASSSNKSYGDPSQGIGARWWRGSWQQTPRRESHLSRREPHLAHSRWSIKHFMNPLMGSVISGNNSGINASRRYPDSPWSTYINNFQWFKL